MQEHTIITFFHPLAWMESFSALLALCAGYSLVTGRFPSQRPVTRSFDVFFDLRLNKRLNKQSRRRWFETPSPSLWHHCNVPENYSNTVGANALISKYDIHCLEWQYRQTSNISLTLVGNKSVEHRLSGLPQQHLHSRLTTFFNAMGKGNCKTRRETFKFGDLVRLVLEIWR